MLAAGTLSFSDNFDLQRRQPKPLSWWQPHPEQHPSGFPHRLEYFVPLSRLERSKQVLSASFNLTARTDQVDAGFTNLQCRNEASAKLPRRFSPRPEESCWSSAVREW
uniref:(northern house mosquito) hypothetical protein n=1 Tax=Culex pipiens TaxID=7175 RepID=A0A8D8PG16_CULPI